MQAKNKYYLIHYLYFGTFRLFLDADNNKMKCRRFP